MLVVFLASNNLGTDNETITECRLNYEIIILLAMII